MIFATALFIQTVQPLRVKQNFLFHKFFIDKRCNQYKINFDATSHPKATGPRSGLRGQTGGNNRRCDRKYLPDLL